MVKRKKELMMERLLGMKEGREEKERRVNDNEKKENINKTNKKVN